MSEEQEPRQYGEKQEKQEKEEEKQEKSWEEKWRHDPINAAVWAIVLIWGGVVLLASNFHLLDWLPFLEGWSLFFLGAGALLLLEVGLRQLMPAYRQPVLGTLVLALVFLAIALGSMGCWKCILPCVVITAGIYLLYRGLVWRREQ